MTSHRQQGMVIKLVATEQYYWKRRVQEALKIRSHPNCMSLDCGLSLSTFMSPNIILFRFPVYCFHLLVVVFIYITVYLPFSCVLADGSS